MLVLLVEDDLDLVLNDKDQRIILVANHYRKEVTSTVLWLLDHEIQIQCFKATPYSIGDNLLLNIEQIIPVPEASEFIIDLKEKAKEDRGKSQRVAETEAQLLKFWKENPPENFPNYASGSWGPKEADAMIEKDGRAWRTL